MMKSLVFLFGFGPLWHEKIKAQKAKTGIPFPAMWHSNLKSPLPETLRMLSNGKYPFKCIKWTHKDIKTSICKWLSSVTQQFHVNVHDLEHVFQLLSGEATVRHGITLVNCNQHSFWCVKETSLNWIITEYKINVLPSENFILHICVHTQTHRNVGGVPAGFPFKVYL